MTVVCACEEKRVIDWDGDPIACACPNDDQTDSFNLAVEVISGEWNVSIDEFNPKCDDVIQEYVPRQDLQVWAATWKYC